MQTNNKLREALKMCLLYIACAESVGIGTITLNDKVKLDPKKIIKSAKEALAAPPRNCDKYANHNDAMKAFEAFVREQGKLGFINPYTEAFKWLFAPATEQEGGTDGNE